MTKSTLRRLPGALALTGFFFGAPLSAQPAPTPAPATPAQPVPAQPAPAQPAPAQPAPIPVQPAPAPVEPAPAPVEPAPAPAAVEPVQPVAPATSIDLGEPHSHGHTHEAVPPQLPPEDTAGLAWYDAIEFRAFVDAYLGMNYLFPKPQSGANGVTRAYDTENGFSLAWFGVDASYPAEPVGGTVSLRLGPSATRIGRGCLAGTCDDSVGLSYVKQAFGSWRPGGAGSAVQLDLGKFDTIYGAEVAESQDNLNYTRGLVYWFAQPLFHTGLRVSAELSEELTLRALLVNGYNNTIDNNIGKDLGVQLALALPRSSIGGGTLFSASLGYLVGPERDDYKVVECGANQHFDSTQSSGCAAGAPSGGESQNGVVDRDSNNWEGLRHLIDLVASLTPTDNLTVQLNADLVYERLRDTVDEERFVQHMLFGAMLGARYGFSDAFGIAARGEYVSDPDGVYTGFAPNDIELVSGTLTIDYRPADYLLLRLENRLDWSSKQIFRKSVREFNGVLPTTTLGVVVTTN